MVSNLFSKFDMQGWPHRDTLGHLNERYSLSLVFFLEVLLQLLLKGIISCAALISASFNTPVSQRTQSYYGDLYDLKLY